MTDQSFPITPPDALRAQWRTEAPIYRDFGVGRENWLIDRAAQWGADQELEACLERILDVALADRLRAARRPKPPSEADRALEELELLRGDAYSMGVGFDAPAIQRALEHLKELEGLAND